MSGESGVRHRKANVPANGEAVELPSDISKDKVTKDSSDSLYLDLIILLCILFLGSLKLFNNIEVPQDIVWDETHFTKFSTWYYTGHYFVDIHPPLAKLVMAAVIWFTGYESLNETDVEWWTHTGFVGTKDYENIYNSYTYIAVRQASAIAGLLLIACAYWLIRVIGCKRFAAIFTCWMLLFDNLITLYSRLILTDIYLWLFHMATIAASFTSTRREYSFPKQVFWCAITGFFLGCTISVKYTGWGCMGLIGVHQFIHLLYSHRHFWGKPIEVKEEILNHFYKVFAIKAFTILSITLLVFFSIWTIHLTILPYQGQGDGFMDPEFQKTLIPFQTEKEIEEAKRGGCPNHANSWNDCGFPTITEEQCRDRGCCWDPTSKSKWCYPSTYTAYKPKYLSLFTKIRMALAATWANNQGVELNEHPTMSRWYEWPFLTGKLVDYGFGIYSMGNLVVWYFAAIVVILSSILTPLYFLSQLFSRNANSSPRGKKPVITTPSPYSMPAILIVATLLIGYFGNLLPFYLIVRSTWNYHYALALLVGICLSGFTCDLLVRKTKLSILFYLVLMAAMVYSFYHWYNFTYGPTLSRADTLNLRLVDKWIAL